MNKEKVIDLSIQTLVAAIYATLTVVLAPISYGQIQLRLSEIMIILVLFNKRYLIGLTIGCLIANMFSPMLWLDMPFGTLATLLSCYTMILFKKRPYIALLMPSIFNGIIIGVILHFSFEIPLIMTMIYVFLGEFVVCYIIGLPIYYYIKKSTYVSIFDLSSFNIDSKIKKI